MDGFAPLAPHEPVAGQDAAANDLRRRIGLVAAPVVFALAWWLAPESLSPQAGRVLAVLAATLVLWLTEAVPVAVTAVFAPAAAVVLGVGPADKVFAPFGNPLLFLFLGAFLLAAAAERTRLDRLLAERLFPHATTSPKRTLVTTTLVTAGMSSVFSNTATTAMMMPVVRAAVARLGPKSQAVGVLSAAYASSLGGVLTPIGTPPNLLAMAALSQYAKVDVPFFVWTVIAAPMAAILLGQWIVMLLATLRREGVPESSAPTPTAPVDRQRPPPLDLGQRMALVAVAVAAVGWLLPGVLEMLWTGKDPLVKSVKAALPEGVVAVLAASLLFMLPLRRGPGRRPLLTWPEAVHIDWGTILLFGGGLALGEQVFQTGLSQWIGNVVIDLTGVKSEWGLTILFTVTALVLSELASNTATAALICPLAVMTAQQVGVSPVAPCIAAALAASMGFLMPISTAPNAIVYGTGKVPLATMLRTGIWLDLTGLVIIPPVVMGMTRMVGLR